MASILDRPLYLTSTPRMFAGWLEAQTNGMWLHRFSTERGWITLQQAHPSTPVSDQHIVMTMYGHYQWTQSDESTGELIDRVQPLGTLVTFTIRAISPDRIEIVTDCTQSAVKPLLDQLSAAITRAWLDARQTSNVSHEPQAATKGSQRGPRPIFRDHAHFKSIVFPLIRAIGPDATQDQLMDRLPEKLTRPPQDSSTLYRYYKKYGYPNFAALVKTVFSTTV